MLPHFIHQHAILSLPTYLVPSLEEIQRSVPSTKAVPSLYQSSMLQRRSVDAAHKSPAILGAKMSATKALSEGSAKYKFCSYEYQNAQKI